ncbi:MAG: hypothetical protein GY722_02345, partial [bacterium]|nr:hypothetical protein [bacterium]
MVSSVELSAFGGATATYTLVHTPTEIERQKYGPPDCVDGSDPPALITVPLLTQLILPDDSFYEMSYNTNDSSPGVLSGGIKKLRLPTGGELHWDYQQLDFLSQAPDLNFDARVNTAYAVETKEIFDAPGSQVGQWSYDYVTHSGAGGNPSAPGDPSIVPCFHTVTVTDPLGHATVNYFDSAALSRWQYGLPMRRCDDQGALLDDPPYPSQEIYDGGPDGELLRSVYVDYGSDGRDSGQHQEKNHRLKQRKVVYHDDSDVFKEVTYSNFDGLGHFRQVVSSGNFAGDQERTGLTSYNPDNLTLLMDPEESQPLPGNNFIMPGQGDPWVLQTFERREVEENGE